MSKTAHKSLRLAALAASLVTALALQPALAEGPMMSPAGKGNPEQCPHMAGHGYGTAHMQEKLDELSKKLHLKDNQQAAWTQYRTQLTEMGEAHRKNMETMASKRQQMRDLPAPERLQKMAEHMRAKADDLDKLAKSTGTFYKTLSPEQQTIFDLYQRNLHPKHHRMMKHH